MLIMVDVDSTLMDSDLLFNRLAKEAEVPWIPRSYNWFYASELGVERKALTDVFRKAHSHEGMMSMEPYEGAAEVLNKVCEDYPEVVVAYVSDRNAQSENALRNWLVTHHFLDHGQKVVCSKDKREWLRAWRPPIVIDDRVRTMAMARYDLGAQVLAIKHNHNLNLVGEIEGIYICDDWWELQDKLENEVLPMYSKHV